ncbi:MAG: hypothetical protein E6K18_01330 [Methanobacteriota archaeon]|nr:MAG: hypothetical protein E6K18_01330 [Euryarchaeota archaeon]
MALGLLFLIPVVPSQGPMTTPPTTPAVDATTVRVMVDGSQAATLGSDVEVVQSYGSFVVARASPAAIARLSARGLTVTPEDTYTLHVNGFVFDTREGAMVPAALAAVPTPGVASYYLVQFVGPVKADWRFDIEGVGARVAGYVANNAYLVRATADQLAAIRTLAEVQWTGYYEPAFRVSPDLLTTPGTVTVDAVVFDGEPVNAVVAAMNKLGLRYVGIFSPNQGILTYGAYDGFGLVRARLDASLLISIARLRMVRYIEPYEMPHLTNSIEAAVMQTNSTTPPPAGSWRVWDMGIKGDGQTIALSDTGLDYDHSQFRQSQGAPVVLGNGDIYNTTNFGRRKVVRYLTMSQYVGVDPWTTGYPDAIQDSPNGFCGSGHGTATAGSAAGDDSTFTPQSPEDGMAPNAKIIEMDIGGVDQAMCNDVLSYIPNDYATMFGAGYTNGARIFSNSWGATSAAYTLEASMVDRFVWNNPDATILFANGNNPPNPLVGSPATAKNDISVSGAFAWTNRDNMGAASRGPTTDGRRKPDVTTFFCTGNSGLCPGATGGTALSDGDLSTLNSAYSPFGGTSYATPVAAGLTALVRQYFTAGWYPRGLTGGQAIFPSAALLKGLLAATSVPMASASACPGSDNHYPNIAQGWGRVFLDEGLYFSGDTKKLFVSDNRQGIATGDTVTYKVRLASPAGKFRAFLAYSDAPGIENANPALVNNLDLDVTDPGGTEYKGNVQGTCGSGQTLTGGSFDQLNNLEGVVRNVAGAGDWTVKVIGANVPMGPQRYALVIIADLDRTYGVLELDRTVYSESDTITATVTDSDAASVSVTFTSNTEPAGESIALAQSVPGSQIWRGQVPTAYGVPASDGQLQVSCGDTIIATYNDVSPPHAAVVTARVDCDFPIISNVRVTGISNSAATVQWTTDKPADSFVNYGLTVALGTTASDPTFTTAHAVTLNNLATATQYYFDVSSTRTGHKTTDDNGGRHYAFKTAAKAEVLLVIGDASFSAERLEMDRDALRSSGWSFNEWQVPVSGDPPLTTLQTYKAVLWEVGLEEYPPLPDATSAILKTYVDNGGRFYIDGHDVGWAACDGGSAFFTPARCNFVNSVLKFNYATDPQTVAQERGQAADPISGGYTAGVTYVPHRTGGAADEGTLLNIGGTTTYVWQTTTGDAIQTDAVKWISSLANGTANPGCIWCGAPSRVAFFAFEFTGLNYVPGVYNNAARTDIMNKTIIWLLGRAPPFVRVSSPNGGEVISASPMVATWSHSPGLGSQEIWYSQDAGQSWYLLKSVPAGNNSDPIDVSDVNLWPCGNRYLIRVVVTDTGTPPFTGQDDSNAVFTINLPGCDIVGPVVRAGSLRVSPNPLKNNVTVTINATIDDSLTGGSIINQAEYFVQPAMPTPVDYGSGTPMNPADGAFNTPVEAVTIPRAVPEASGTILTIWVHGLDAALNWGPFGGGNSTGGSKIVLVIPAVTGVIPNPPTGVSASLTGGTFADVRVTWQIPAGPPIDKFQVFVSNVYDPSKTGYSLLQDNIAPTASSWDHVGGGSGNANNYFYYVCAVGSGGPACSATQAAKFTRTLATAGWNLVSIPVTLQDARTTVALQTLSWRTARTFNLSAPDQWKAWYTAKNNGDLPLVSRGMALWVDVVTPKDFTVAGQVPGTTTLNLGLGWNFVGYTGFIPANANAAASFTGRGATRLQGYVASPQYYLTNLPLATTTLQPGSGYWVYITNPGAWTVTN